MDTIVAALKAVGQARADAEAAQHLVRLQAIHALSERGMSAREIAALDLGMSKSTVGRLMRDDLGSVAEVSDSAVPEIVAAAWHDSAR